MSPVVIKPRGTSSSVDVMPAHPGRGLSVTVIRKMNVNPQRGSGMFEVAFSFVLTLLK